MMASLTRIQERRLTSARVKGTRDERARIPLRIARDCQDRVRN
jgi:hypothetical protein